MNIDALERPSILVWHKCNKYFIVTRQLICSCAYLHLTSEVVLKLNEVSKEGRAKPRGMIFSIRVDLNTWEPILSEEQSESDLTNAKEPMRILLNQLSKEEKETISTNYEVTLSHQRRLATYTFDRETMEQGQLVSYWDMVEQKGGIHSGGPCCSFQFSYHGMLYFIEELYCPTPGCHCDEVHVGFARGEEILKDRKISYIWRHCFFVRCALKKNKYIITDCKISESDAMAVISQWKKGYPEHKKMFRERYKIIKKIGRRTLDSFQNRSGN